MPQVITKTTIDVVFDVILKEVPGFRSGLLEKALEVTSRLPNSDKTIVGEESDSDDSDDEPPPSKKFKTSKKSKISNHGEGLQTLLKQLNNITKDISTSYHLGSYKGTECILVQGKRGRPNLAHTAIKNEATNLLTKFTRIIHEGKTLYIKSSFKKLLGKKAL
jgi:hypothetical protein